MRLLSRIETIKRENRLDIYLSAEFTQEEIDSFSLVSPTICVSMVNGLIFDITLCDEGFPVSCIFTCDEINEITQFIQTLSENTNEK